VYLTKDKKVVIFHDHDLSRVCGNDLQISDFNYHDLPPISDEIPVHFEVGYTIAPKSASERQIPLLKDLFKRHPDLPMNIDLKDPDKTLAKKVNSLIKKFSREKITIWGSFDAKQSKFLHHFNPDIPLFFPMKSILKTYLKLWTGILPFVGGVDEDFMQIPMATDAYMRHKFAQSPSIFEKLKTFAYFSFVKAANFTTPLLIPYLNQRGIWVSYWVLNSPLDFLRAYDHGANGIMTDSPTALNGFLLMDDAEKDGLTLKMFDMWKYEAMVAREGGHVDLPWDPYDPRYCSVENEKTIFKD
jgi:lysophospholipase D